MQVKIKLSDNDIAFVYDDVINIGEFLDIIQLMIKEKGTVLITKSSIEYIRIYLDGSDEIETDAYDLGYNSGYTDAMNDIAESRCVNG